MPRSTPLAWLVTLPLLAPALRAQEPGSGPAPAAEAPAKSKREQQLEKLREVTVHFDFARAPLGDVTRALERASGVPVRIGDKGAQALAKRRFKLKYVADRTGIQVLEDLSKAAALDWEVTDEGALLDQPEVLKKLRKELGLPARSTRLTPEDVEKLLDQKKLDLTARERTLDEVLEFLRKETGIGFVQLGAEEAVASPRVTLATGELPLRTVLDRLAAKVHLAWARQGNVIALGPEEAVRPPPAEEGQEPPDGDE